MNIKNLIALTIMIIILSSCDPFVNMEANIENSTSKQLSLEFVSYDASLSQSFQINPGQTVLFQVYDGYGTYVEPILVDFDSVVIKNQMDKILKVYKRNSIGKNIYNIDKYWTASEPSKRFFKYKFEIEVEDIE